MMRAFVAIELGAPQRDALVQLIAKLPRSRDVRWCSEAQLHLTLKFLGDVADDQVPQVCEAITAATEFIKPFTIALTDLDCFPNAHSPRVLWCGVDDPESGCARWLELADPLLEELGFPRENRAYHPHITLGRSKSSAGGRVMRTVLDSATPANTPPLDVNEIVLFESRLLPSGAQYVPQHRVSLGRQN